MNFRKAWLLAGSIMNSMQLRSMDQLHVRTSGVQPGVILWPLSIAIYGIFPISLITSNFHVLLCNLYRIFVLLSCIKTKVIGQKMSRLQGQEYGRYSTRKLVSSSFSQAR